MGVEDAFALHYLHSTLYTIVFVQKEFNSFWIAIVLVECEEDAKR